MRHLLSQLLLGRPQVIVDFEFERGLLFLSVQNIGSRSARTIKTRFDRSFTGADGVDTSAMNLFSHLAFLPPGKQIRTFVDSATDYFARDEPVLITTTTAYADDTGRQFSSSTLHDLRIYQDIRYVE